MRCEGKEVRNSDDGDDEYLMLCPWVEEGTCLGILRYERIWRYL
jgi:hypothetical protein